jgi:hypothetical protein
MSGDAVRVRVAEPLRFLLFPRHRHGDVRVRVDGSSTLLHIVESLGVPRTEIGQLQVGGRTVPGSARARAGEVIDVLAVSRPQQIADPRFLLDVHLGTLARRMRLLGIDTEYHNDATDDQIIVRAAADRRAVLTQDRGLLRRRGLVAGAYVRGERPDDQLADVLDRFAVPLNPWSRCLLCNGLLEPIDPQEVRHLLQPGTRRSYTSFYWCAACRRPFWRGAHAWRLDAIVATATARHPEVRRTASGSASSPGTGNRPGAREPPPASRR